MKRSPHAMELRVFGFSCRLVTLEKLIAIKRAAGRPQKDSPANGTSATVSGPMSDS